MRADLRREIAREVIVRAFEMAQMTGLCKRCMHAAKYRFDATSVFRIHVVEELLERRHVGMRLRIGDELRRQSAAEADMHAPYAFGLQHEIPEVARRQCHEMGWVNGEQRRGLAPVS